MAIIQDRGKKKFIFRRIRGRLVPIKIGKDKSLSLKKLKIREKKQVTALKKRKQFSRGIVTFSTALGGVTAAAFGTLAGNSVKTSLKSAAAFGAVGALFGAGAGFLAKLKNRRKEKTLNRPRLRTTRALIKFKKADVKSVNVRT